MGLFGDQQCHAVTLSQVSSSAALSHSKAFQFMSSTEKDIGFKYNEDYHVHNGPQLKKHLYKQHKSDLIKFHIIDKIHNLLVPYGHSIKVHHRETGQLLYAVLLYLSSQVLLSWLLATTLKNNT